MPDDRSRQALEASTRKWMVAGTVLMGLFVLAFPLYRIYEPAQRADAREAQAAFLALEGAHLFEANCADCHGVAGGGALAPAIGSKGFLQSADDRQISQLTSVGVPGTEMVAYSNDFGGPLTSAQITAITVYLRSLEEDAPSIPGWRAPLEDTRLTADQVYALACARCHGIDREGIEDRAPDISVDSITMMETDEWLAARIADGYKEMPRFGRALSGEQIASLVAFLRGGTVPPPDTATTDSTAPQATTPTVGASPATDEVLALGEVLYQEKAGGRGCQECHGRDANGTVNGPSIRTSSRSSIVRGLNGGVPDMDFQPRLTSEEVEAVYLYLQWLLTQG